MVYSISPKWLRHGGVFTELLRIMVKRECQVIKCIFIEGDLYLVTVTWHIY